jgi:release factor glutamine methyltransferase
VSLPTTLKPESLGELYLRGVRLLKGVSRPDIEARVLLLHAAGIPEEAFHAHPGSRPSVSSAKRFLRMAGRRAAGVPLAYLTGRKEFWSLLFRVGPGVLIPRPETELLVEKTVGFASGRRKSLLDLGTGSGNIAVALARELPLARITATDISVRALRIAKANAASTGCPGIRFVRSDLFSAFGRPGPRFDIIVSNPPYIGRQEWAGLPADVRDREPRRALVGGFRGTEFTERLVREARRFLNPRGRLLLEFGAGQEEAVRAMFGAGWDELEVFPDLAGIPRVVTARKAAAARGAVTSRSPTCGNP